MFKWKKKGQIFDPSTVQGKDWIKEYTQAPWSVEYEDFIRVYFSCRPHPDSNVQYVSYSAFVDLDKNDLTKVIRLSENPILPLGEKGCFDEFGTYPVCVVKNKSDYLAYYGGWTRCESIPFTVSIGLAKSLDEGKTFQKLGPGPLITSNIHDPFVTSGPKVRFFNGVWYMWYVAGTEWIKNNDRVEAVFKIRMATSIDGLNWKRDGRNLIENKLEENECQASPDVFYFEGLYHMFFCYKYCFDFRNNNRGYQIGYASSNDMIVWSRDDSQAGLEISTSGWDDQSIAYPNILEINNKIYMFYIGNNVGKTGFGLAEMTEYSPVKGKE